MDNDIAPVVPAGNPAKSGRYVRDDIVYQGGKCFFTRTTTDRRGTYTRSVVTHSVSSRRVTILAYVIAWTLIFIWAWYAF